MKKEITLRFYTEKGHALPSYDYYAIYDTNDDKSFYEAYARVGRKLQRVCEANKGYTGSITEEEVIED